MSFALGADGPCPCESGRPLRECCWSRYAAEVDTWRRVQEAERRLARSIITYGLGTWGWPLFAAAFRHFAPAAAAPDALLYTLPVFDRWLAYTWVARLEDDTYVPEDWPDASLGLSWLSSAAPSVDAFDEAFIVTAAEASYSLFQVDATRPGWSLSMRNLLTGEPLVAVDPEISTRARPDDLLFGAAHSMNGLTLLLGLAPYSVPTEALADLRGFRADYSKNGEWMAPADVAELDLTFELCETCTRLWGRGSAGFLDSGADIREPLHLNWTVSIPFADALECLRPLTVCYDDDDYVEVSIGPRGDPHALFMWFERRPSDDPDDWVCIGYLYLTDGRLAADVPSRRLADRLLNEVQQRLGGAATWQGTRSAMPVRVHDRGCWVPVPGPSSGRKG